MRAYGILLTAGLFLMSGGESQAGTAKPRRISTAPVTTSVAPAGPADASPVGGGIDRRAARFLPSPSSTALPAVVPVSAADPAEICDGTDNDGNGEIDEALTRPCASACASGTETCAAGEWMACSARPCCDTMVGPGLPTSSICPAAETADVTLCLMPGIYSIPAGCRVRSSLVGLANPEEIIIEGDVTLTEVLERVQGVTITGRLQSEEPLDLIQNRLLNGVRFNNEDFFAFPPLLQIIHNDVRGGINIEFPSFIHANSIAQGLSLNADHSDRYIVTENHLVGGGVTVSQHPTVYLAGNLIESVGIGISLPCYGSLVHIVANRIIAGTIGVNVCVNGEAWLLRNDISSTGSGAAIYASNFRIEGNQIVRPFGGASPNGSGGVGARVNSDGCPSCGGTLRDNTIVGGGRGITVDHDFTGSHAVLTGNIVVGHSGTGVEICARDRCPASPLYSVTALSNDISGGSALWLGTDDPTGLDGNISADPEFVDPAAGDYRLDEGSPCIDAGALAHLSVDLPGRPRNLDGDGDGIAVPDMGAWEAGSTCRDQDGDGFGSPGDGECGAGSTADCDDTDSAIHPGAVDLPGNTIYESCDGSPAACNPERREGWRNHGQFVSCVARTVSRLVTGGLITSDEGELLVHSAAKSQVGM